MDYDYDDDVEEEKQKKNSASDLVHEDTTHHFWQRTNTRANGSVLPSLLKYLYVKQEE